MRQACTVAVLLFVPPAFAESTGDVRDVRVVRSADQEARAAALGQPSIARWREAHLVVAYQRNIAGKTDMGSIDAVVSGNDGDSRSIPSTIFDHEQRHGAMQFGYCNDVLYRPPGQEVVWCFAMRCPLNYSDSEDSHLAAASSGDGGRSWNPVGSNRPMVAGGFQLMKIVEAMTRDADEVLGRPRDVRFAIDRADEWNRTHDILRGRLDLDRVGVMGHSFGAFTTLAVCGMRPALEWLSPRVAPGKGLGPDLRDERVRCGVALSPQGVGEPFFIRESFGSLAVPLLGITGTLDKQQGGLPAENRRDAFALWPDGPHRLVWLTNARHVDFTDSTGIRRLELPSPTRADVQPIVRAASLLFFDSQLRGSAEAATRFTSDGLKPFLQGGVTGVKVLTK